MYVHLLVPVDGTPLASATAVAHARAGGARLTFVHARADLAARRSSRRRDDVVSLGRFRHRDPPTLRAQRRFNPCCPRASTPRPVLDL